MAQVYPRLSETELNSLSSKAEAALYRQLRDLDYPGARGLSQPSHSES